MEAGGSGGKASKPGNVLGDFYDFSAKITQIYLSLKFYFKTCSENS